jgi:hypothetical protein
MINIPLPDELAKHLEAIAQRENRPLAEVVAAMLEQYDLATGQGEIEERHPLDAFIGIYDDDITDMSTSVRRTIRDHFGRKNERAD